MGFFNNKNKVLDLTEKLKRRQQQINDIKSEQKEEVKTASATPFSFFDNPVSTPSTQASRYSDDSPQEEKRKKLLKTLSDLTARLEDLSTQIYKLEQRVELLEKKSNLQYS